MTTAADWFTKEAEFRQLCGDAVSLAASERGQEFAHEMMLGANKFGLQASITDAQLRWLCKIAEWDVPKFRGVT